MDENHARMNFYQLISTDKAPVCRRYTRRTNRSIFPGQTRILSAIFIKFLANLFFCIVFIFDAFSTVHYNTIDDAHNAQGNPPLLAARGFTLSAR